MSAVFITLALTVLTGLLSWGLGRVHSLTRTFTPKEEHLNTTRTVLSEAVRLSLWPLQAALWIGWLYLITGLFTWSRPLQVRLFTVLIGPLPGIVLVIVAGVFAVRLGYVLIDLLFEAIREGRFLARTYSVRLDLRVNTFSGVFKGTLTIVVVALALVLVLRQSGLDIGPLLAGAGILGLAFSFGAQSLIKDIINGFFILFEDQYGVGDVVIINGNDGLGGLVEDINLRITRLRNTEGRLITIPNSEVKTVANLSSQWARVDIKVPVPHDVDIDRVMAMMSREVSALRAEPGWQEKILEEPEMLGVDALSDTGVVLRMLVKTAPLQQWRVDRAVRRRLKLAFDRESIRFTGLSTAVQLDPGQALKELAEYRRDDSGKS